MEKIDWKVLIFSWYLLSPTLHKVLEHGKQVIDNFPLPIGWFSEECSECANKIFKRFRQNRARKCSRVANMKDVYHRMINVSDPLVLHSPINKNLAYAKNVPLSDTVKSMLLPFSIKDYITFEDYMKEKWWIFVMSKDEFLENNSKLLFEIDFTNKIGSNVEIKSIKNGDGSYNDSYSCDTMTQI